MNKINPHFVERFLMRNWFQLAIIALITFSAWKNHDVAPESSTPAHIEEEQVEKQEMSFAFVPKMKGERLNVKPKAGKKVVIIPKSKRTVKRIDGKVQQFLDRFGDVAVTEQMKFQVPASIILANAILLSDLGANGPSAEASNYFMLPCTRSWTGDSMDLGNACYRWYDSAWDSFRDHSEFLEKNLDPKDLNTIEDWAKAIDQIGWTNVKAKDILGTIHKYNLKSFDYN